MCERGDERGDELGDELSTRCARGGRQAGGGIERRWRRLRFASAQRPPCPPRLALMDAKKPARRPPGGASRTVSLVLIVALSAACFTLWRQLHQLQADHKMLLNTWEEGGARGQREGRIAHAPAPPTPPRPAVPPLQSPTRCPCTRT